MLNMYEHGSRGVLKLALKDTVNLSARNNSCNNSREMHSYTIPNFEIDAILMLKEMETPECAMKTAVIDIGSNSIIMLVAKCKPGGEIEPEGEIYAVTRLGEGVHKTGNLSEDAAAHTLEVLKEMKLLAEKEQVDQFIVTASSAVRNAVNKSDFLVKCYECLEIFPQVLSKKEEARFSFMGTAAGYSEMSSIVSIDIGGGSTEVGFGSRNILMGTESMDIGCISLCESFSIGKGIEWIHNRIRAKKYIHKKLAKLDKTLDIWLEERAPVIVATGGTATTYGAVLLEQDIFDRKQINQVRSNRKELNFNYRRIARMSLKKRKALRGLPEDRAEIFPAGLLILSTFLEHYGFDNFGVTGNGLRMGILRSFMRGDGSSD